MPKIGFVSLPVADLVKADWNYKVADEDLKSKLKENIRTNGFIENLIVRELPNGKYEVVNGNHRLDVVKELGLKSVMCYNLGTISDAKAKKIAIETNETKFTANPFELSNLIKEITEEFPLEELLKTFPYTSAELEALAATVEDVTFDSFTTEIETLPEVKPKPSGNTIICPNCGFEIKK